MEGVMSERDTSRDLEPALQRTEADADASLNAAAAVTRSLKRFRSVVHDGNLRDLKAALSAVEQTTDGCAASARYSRCLNIATRGTPRRSSSAWWIAPAKRAPLSPGCSRNSVRPTTDVSGFEKVPMDEVTVNIALKKGAPAMLVRAGTERDYDAICAMYATCTAGAHFALRRDPAALHYAVSKKRLFAGLSAPGTHALEFFVAEEGTAAAAYVVLSQNKHGWTLEEAGDRDPAGARLGGMLQVLAARDPSRPAPLIRAWWPRSFPVPPRCR